MKKRMRTVLSTAGVLLSTFFLPPAATAAGEKDQNWINTVIDLRSQAINSYRNGDMAEAAALYGKAVAMGDSSMVPLYNLACCYGRMGMTEKCIHALKLATDRGYMDYVEMTGDRDLSLIWNTPQWPALCRKAFENADGKVPNHIFHNELLAVMLKNDSLRLKAMLCPALRTAGGADNVEKTLKHLWKSSQHMGITSAEELAKGLKTARKELKYELQHFVKQEHFVLELFPQLFASDFTPMLTRDHLHIYCSTTDDSYAWVDSLKFESSLGAGKAAELADSLTDSLYTLGMITRGKDILHVEGLMARSGRLCETVVKTLESGVEISENEFRQIINNADTAEICFVRLNSLPVKPAFKGLKVAWHPGCNAAVVVKDEKYMFMKAQTAKMEKALRKEVE